MADPRGAAGAGRLGMTVVAVVAVVGGWFALTVRDGDEIAPPTPTVAPQPDRPRAPMRRPRPVAITRSSR